MKPVEIVFTPVDNQRLANLCGALDENLRQIETALDVSIARRGERFAVTGSPAQAKLAAKVLQRFYDRAKQRPHAGRRAARADRGGAARASRARPTAARRSITRRPDLHGRTPRQVQYLQNILTHDITFSIGPAGTGKTYLAVACAVDALEREAVKRIVLVRPAVEAGERLGFLPGDMAAEGRSLPAPALRRALRPHGLRQGRQAASSAARSRSPRSPSCAGARSTTRS